MTADDHLDLLWCPFPDRAAADAAAATLIEEGLAACVHVLTPVTSHYVWQGQAERAEEVPILCKIAAGGAARARQRLADLHSYDLPAIVDWQGTCDPAVAAWARGA
jgi:periplasmic divalent cation tolerance protein